MAEHRPVKVLQYELRQLSLILEEKWDYLEDYEKDEIYDYITKWVKKGRDI